MVRPGCVPSLLGLAAGVRLWRRGGGGGGGGGGLGERAKGLREEGEQVSRARQVVVVVVAGWLGKRERRASTVLHEWQPILRLQESDTKNTPRKALYKNDSASLLRKFKLTE